MHIFCLLFFFKFSKFIAEFDSNTDYKIKWKILNRTNSKFNIKFGCKLYKLEKIEIVKPDKDITLNKKSERQNSAFIIKNTFITKVKFIIL